MEYNKSLGRSVQPRKQRVYRAEAPLHIKRKFVHAHLSKELRQKHGKRSFSLRKGDKVMIMRGEFKKKTGTVDTVIMNKEVAIITGITISKKDGSTRPRPIPVSNIMITELSLDDKKRKIALERKNNGQKASQKA